MSDDDYVLLTEIEIKRLDGQTHTIYKVIDEGLKRSEAVAEAESRVGNYRILKDEGDANGL